ncbi:MAG: tRNA threonylcarbamoyladenosine dehydratase [Oscillospiraceae bacterium]|nr:tRNA threonylcarbamoyladenosine dehydratase [Oscillospiraceae bacterium]
MKEQFARTALLLGEESMERLHNARVAVFGIGGVGGYAVEALARCGIGTLDLVDSDTVSITNLNRQIIALHSTLDMPKVDAAAARAADINPDIKINRHNCFYLPETAGQFDFTQYDFVIDAIDTVKGKLELVMQCRETKTPLICSMGAGNKLDPTALRVADIYKTSVCPLARVMRYELKKRGIRRLFTVYSEEMPVQPQMKPKEAAAPGKGSVPGSISFVPSAAGLILAGEVIKAIANGQTERYIPK